MNKDLNDEDLNELTAQYSYTKTVFDEEEVFARNTNLSQENLYECDNDDDGEMGMGLAKSDIDDADIDDDMVDIQDNPGVHKRKQRDRNSRDWNQIRTTDTQTVVSVEV